MGIPFDPKAAEQAKAFAEFLRPEGDKSAGEGLETVIDQAPAVRMARADVGVAEAKLADARLRLSWTEIRSEVAGYVQNRQVHLEGNRVQPGQTLLSIRPLVPIWIDANYKEAQLLHICIGMPVEPPLHRRLPTRDGSSMRAWLASARAPGYHNRFSRLKTRRAIT